MAYPLLIKSYFLDFTFIALNDNDYVELGAI